MARFEFKPFQWEIGTEGAVPSLPFGIGPKDTSLVRLHSSSYPRVNEFFQDDFGNGYFYKYREGIHSLVKLEHAGRKIFTLRYDTNIVASKVFKISDTECAVVTSPNSSGDCKIYIYSFDDKDGILPVNSYYGNNDETYLTINVGTGGYVSDLLLYKNTLHAIVVESSGKLTYYKLNTNYDRDNVVWTSTTITEKDYSVKYFEDKSLVVGGFPIYDERGPFFAFSSVFDERNLLVVYNATNPESPKDTSWYFDVEALTNNRHQEVGSQVILVRPHGNRRYVHSSIWYKKNNVLYSLAYQEYYRYYGNLFNIGDYRIYQQQLTNANVKSVFNYSNNDFIDETAGNGKVISIFPVVQDESIHVYIRRLAKGNTASDELVIESIDGCLPYGDSQTVKLGLNFNGIIVPHLFGNSYIAVINNIQGNKVTFFKLSIETATHAFFTYIAANEASFKNIKLENIVTDNITANESITTKNLTASGNVLMDSKFRIGGKKATNIKWGEINNGADPSKSVINIIGDDGVNISTEDTLSLRSKELEVTSESGSKYVKIENEIDTDGYSFKLENYSDTTGKKELFQISSNLIGMKVEGSDEDSYTEVKLDEEKISLGKKTEDIDVAMTIDAEGATINNGDLVVNDSTDSIERKRIVFKRNGERKANIYYDEAYNALVFDVLT